MTFEVGQGGRVPEVSTQQAFGSDFCQHQASRLVHLPSNTQRFDSAFTLVCLTSAARYLAKQFPLVKFELVGKVTEDFTMESDKLSSEKVKDFGSTKDALWVGSLSALLFLFQNPTIMY